MAPPNTRRPGYSRRAQYGMFFGYVLAVGGILVAIGLLVLARSYPDLLNPLRGAALDVTAPVAAGGRSAVRVASESGAGISGYFNAAAQNAELRRQIRDMRQRILKARVTETENQRLKQLLGLREQVSDEVALGRIVTSSFDTSRRLATLAAGSSDGVRIGQPVRAPEGLIGRIIETGRWASRVLLVTDGASNVPVRLLRNGIPAMATGRGDGTIDIKPLEVGQNPFRRGDVFVTSGTGGIYPPGVPVAMVTRIDRDETTARPIADPARADFAVVQTIFQPSANQPLSTAGPAERTVPAPAQALEPTR